MGAEKTIVVGSPNDEIRMDIDIVMEWTPYDIRNIGDTTFFSHNGTEYSMQTGDFYIIFRNQYSMEKLKESRLIIRYYNLMPLKDVVKEFEKYSGQQIEPKIVSEFDLIGLENTDFLFSDYLHQKGYRNLFTCVPAITKPQPPSSRLIKEGAEPPRPIGHEREKPGNASVEFLHEKIMDLYYKFVRNCFGGGNPNTTKVRITGEDLNNMIAEAKTNTYDNFRNQNLISEKILCAAVWYKDLQLLDNLDMLPVNCDKGIVFCGFRHYQCVHQMVNMTGKRQCEAGEEVHGFLTNKNRFVDRKEAFEIAKRENQIITDDAKYALYSEDLY